MKRFAFACAALVAHSALGDISVSLAVNADNTYATQYPLGDKPPEAPCEFPTDWSELIKGTGNGQVCGNSATEFELTVIGADDEGDQYGAYKECQLDDCEVIARVPDVGSWSGHNETFTSFLVGISEGTGDSAWYFHTWVTPDGRVRCKGGTPGPDDYNVNGSVNQLPEYLAVTRDVSLSDYGCWQSNDGVTWTRFGTYSRAGAQAIGYVAGTSHDTTASTTATLTAIDLNTTLTIYTPSGPPTGSPPTQTATINPQTGTQGNAFSLDISGNFTGETPTTHPYTATGLPVSTGLSMAGTTGILSGTPTSADVTASPYNLSMCAVNVDGPTCQSVQFTFSPAPGSGDVFTVPDVGNTTDSSFDCDNASSGANGASWASVRTSGSGTTVSSGDTILITGGERGDTSFTDCRSNDPENNPIIIAKAASATQLVINGNSGSGSGTFLCTDCVGVKLDGSINWTGHSGGCGHNTATAKGWSDTPLTDCAIVLTGGYAGFRAKGERRFITVDSVEIRDVHYGYWTNDQAYCPGAPDEAPTDINDTSTNWSEGHTLRRSYIHDTSGTATYVGMNISISCGGGVRRLPNTRGVLMEYNYMADLGSNGVHIKRIPGSDATQAIVRYNYIARVGDPANQSSGANNKPIAFFEASGTAHDNVVEDTIADDPEGPGLACSINHRPEGFGEQYCHFYNNVVFGTRNSGFTAGRDSCSAHSDGPTTGCTGGQRQTANMSYRVEYNTFVNVALATGNCINSGGEVTASGSIVRKNICAGADTTIQTGASESNNVTGSVASMNFQNSATDDYRLTSSSSFKNTGGSAGCPGDDILGVVRPQAGVCDAGAYEFDE